MKKVAIIGASYLQLPLILKAKDCGYETHVFAWGMDDVGEKAADFFYPISIVDKERILEQCRQIGIDGICSIASDLAIITVNYVAEALGLIGNGWQCVEVSTNKYKMRQCFWTHGDPAPESWLITCEDDLKDVRIEEPVIVKPVDRSGSRGITKVDDPEALEPAVKRAMAESFN